MPNEMSTRPARVGSAFAWEVAKHTTERDREIAWLLHRQKILTTDQLRLLFFGSLRRCQDRLLWLHSHRVIDRFYPAGPFSLGKPQAPERFVPSRSYGACVPRISAFYGITIWMYWNEGAHARPHFHARYAGQTASVDFAGSVIAGALPQI